MAYKYEPVSIPAKLVFGAAAFCTLCHTTHVPGFCVPSQNEYEIVAAGPIRDYGQALLYGDHGHNTSSGTTAANVVYLVQRF